MKDAKSLVLIFISKLQLEENVFKKIQLNENHSLGIDKQATCSLQMVFSYELCYISVFSFLPMMAAYIPTPIYFGAVIDTTCMLWQQECGVQGSCWEYNVTSFRFVYFGLAAGLKFVGFIFIFLAWYSIKYKEDELQRRRCRDFPLSTVSEQVGRPSKAEKYSRTTSCPAFSTQGESHEETALQKGFPGTTQTYPGPFSEAESSSADPGLDESLDAAL